MKKQNSEEKTPKRSRFAEKNNLSKQKKIIIAVLFGIIVFGLFLLVILKLTPNKPDNNKATGLAIDDFYSDEQCRCLEREDLRCTNSSWQLDVESRRCVNGKTFTNVILGCSKYECNGITYWINTDINAWEVLK